MEDIIYLDKGTDTGDHLPDTWQYFRVTGEDWLDHPEGTEGARLGLPREMAHARRYPAHERFARSHDLCQRMGDSQRSTTSMGNRP